MFKKKNCPKCNAKITDKFSFCPSCGFNINKNQEEYGMLGQNDYIAQEQNDMQNAMGGMFGGFSGKVMNSMLSNAMKMLEKEMQKSMKEQNFQNQNFNQNQPVNRTNFELYINGKKIPADKIKVTKKPNNQNFQNKKLLTKQEMSQIGNKKPQNNMKSSTPRFTNEARENFQKLPKKQPETNVRRFSNKVVYEIDIPGVESIKDISISQMENSIEIKAISKKNAYEKIIPIGLPIAKYGFSKGKLVLELKEN
jgi:HSP20 family molecular chaperone IbpA